MREPTFDVSEEGDPASHSASLTTEEVRVQDFDTVKDLAARAISVSALLQFLCELHSGIVMRFDPESTTTTDVVFNAIIPLTAASCTSYAEVMNDGQDCYPDLMVSHAWGNLFLHLVAAIVAKVWGKQSYWNVVPHMSTLEHTQELMGILCRKALATKVWLCVFGVNQHVSICPCHTVKYLNGSPKCEMDKFDRMLCVLYNRSGAHCEHLIALDRRCHALRRAWVVSEIATCMNLGMPQNVAVHFPVQISDRNMWESVNGLRVEACESTRPEDKCHILAAIKDKALYNQRVRDRLLTTMEHPDFFERVFLLVMVPGILLLVVTGCLVVMVHYVETPLVERAVFIAVPTVILFIEALPYVYFRVRYTSFIKAFLAADRHGLCRETLAQVPSGALLAKPCMWFYACVARACGGVPHRSRWIGACINLLVCTVMCGLWAPLIFDEAPAKWHVILSWSFLVVLLPIGLSGLDLCYNIIHVGVHFALLCVTALVSTSAVAYYLLESWQRRELPWEYDWVFKAHAIAGWCLLLVTFFSPLVFQALRDRSEGASGQDSKAMAKADAEGTTVYDRICDNTEQWARVSIRVTNIPPLVSQAKLALLLAPFAPTAMSLQLGGKMPSLTRGAKAPLQKAGEDIVRHPSSATASFESEDAARRAAVSLNGREYEGFMLGAEALVSIEVQACRSTPRGGSHRNGRVILI